MFRNIFQRIFQNSIQSGASNPAAARSAPSGSVGTAVPVSPLSRLNNSGAKYGMSLGFNSGFVYTGSNRSDFYRFLRDNIPIVSAAVWTWKNLCATPQRVTIDGNEKEISQAKNILAGLEDRIHPNEFLRGNGVNKLCEDFFLELFTTGSFAGVIVPLADGSGIDYFKQIDASKVIWKGAGKIEAYWENDKGELIPLPRDTFFYSALGTDIKNPGGIEPMSSIPFVVAIEQLMLEDMARSSHNAGNPRMHIRITPPERFDTEGDQEYADRANSYFDETVNQFYKLEADENLFTWGDVEVQIVGAEPGRMNVWKIHREQVIEDVITGLKLFPWALGRSHGTTKNWVQSQFNILMQIVDSMQEAGVVFADWLRVTELRMKGNLAKPHHRFAPNQDPFQLERRQAQDLHFKTVHAKFEGGYLSKEQAMQELGYQTT